MYAILDIEGIQVTHEHICTRKLYILDCCGNDHEEEFVACRDFDQLEEKFNPVIFNTLKTTIKLAQVEFDKIHNMIEANLNARIQ